MADEFVRWQLKSCNLENYIPHFAEQKITEKVFLEMTDRYIAELLPLLGDRHTFINARNKLLSTIASNNVQLNAERNIHEDIPTPIEGSRAFPLREVLRKLLNSTNEGQTILTANSVSDKKRKVLLRIVAQHLLASKQKISYSIIEAWAKAIEELIPGEKATTYYYYDTSKKKPRGKLYNKVSNTKRNEEQEPPPAVNVESNSGAIPIERDERQRLLDKVKFLHPSDKDAVKLWKETYLIRDRKDSIEDYMLEYPIMMTDLAIKLFAVDFEISQKTSSTLFIETWPRIAQRVLAIADEKRLCPLYTDFIPHVEANTLSLLVLPYLFKPVFLDRKSLKKPSRAEMAQAFIIEKPSVASLEPRDANHTGQPTILVIGSLPGISKIFVQINSTRYEMKNLMTAVSFCFHSFFALNASYPRAAEMIWFYIEKYIFKLEHSKSSTLFCSIDDVHRLISE